MSIMRIHTIGMAGLAAIMTVVGATGCSTKSYVRTQTEPLIEHTDQLEAKTVENNRTIHDVNDRAQAGILRAQGAADSANQNSLKASQQADDAQLSADNAVHRADKLESVVKGLDNYRAVSNVTVTFGFDKSELTKDDREQLDEFAAHIGARSSYILKVTGGTDSTGSAEYNYVLSQRRADAVVQYLASKYGIAPHRFYLIGIGKDKEVAPNTSADGRKQNRRVEIELLSNMGDGTEPASNQSASR